MAGDSILPIYNNTATSTSSQTSPSSASASMSSYVASGKAFMGVLAEAGKTVLASQRPWSEVLDKNCFRRPDSIADGTNRMMTNLSYFKVNYVVLTAAIVLFGLLWHPGSLIIMLVLAAAWFYLYLSRTKPVVLFNRSFGEGEVLLVLGIITVVAIFLTSTGSTIMTGLSMASALVALHAVLRTPDDLFLEDSHYVTQTHVNFQPRTIH